MINLKKDNLSIAIYSDITLMGASAAEMVIAKLKALLAEQDEISMLFAAAPSQSEFLANLTSDISVEWNRINAFHLDEYIGLQEDAPQLFRRFLEENVFGKVPFKNVYYINGQATDYKAECERYCTLLDKHKVDIACIGIGENGHIAFNDPHVADFNDPHRMKVVDLDFMCRMQQVNDKCFDSLDEVPKLAYTLTIPTLMAVKYVYCIVPRVNKANAVYDTINGPISKACPASVLREKQGAILFLDADSASKLDI